ncbi:MAG: hypothetical protein R3342_04840 [Lutibacter sp.]|jgi:hypothetical protein|uniref:hypothetical protein n=1 Tax=Lutibacter sp. TaxID=1925666 RepID=UPI00299E3EE9|nr:hypothetical protein [Lutibacter sp.]MDX1828856.1 hypothetical protein [Lutibacter sp.]
MKTIVKTLLIIGVIGSLVSCKSTFNASETLGKQENRNAVYQEIISNPSQFSEFIDLAQQDDGARKIMMKKHMQMMEPGKMKAMMKSNPEMKEKMKSHMQKMMEENPEMKEKMQTMMLDKMLKNPEGRKMLMQKMKENPKMMEAMMKNPKMKEKMMEEMKNKKEDSKEY